MQTGPSVPIHSSPVAPNAPLPTIDVTSDQTSYSPTSGFTWTGNVKATAGKEFEMHADRLTAGTKGDVDSADGDIFLRELDTTITASKLDYDKLGGSALFENADLYIPPYNLSATRITVLANEIIATNASFTTCPPGVHEDYHVSVQSLTVDQRGSRTHLRAHNAALFIGGTRILAVRNIGVSESAAGPGRKRPETIRSTVSYNNYKGLYLVTGTTVNTGSVPIDLSMIAPERGKWSLAATASKTIRLAPPSLSQDEIDEQEAKGSVIGLIRTLATSTGRPLPAGDPLLYHDFLGGDPLESLFNQPVTAEVTPAATMSYRQPIYGRRIGNLSFSQLPEVSGDLVLPVTGDGNLPDDRDPADVRAALRKVYLFSNVSLQNGYYQEQPTGAQSSRTALGVTLDTRPILIGPNTLFRPRLGYYSANYQSDHDRYQFDQVDLSVQRSYSPWTSIGTEYIATFQGGKDPFVFDSVDTVQELDLRGQVGDGVNIFGSRLKTDLVHRAAIDWQFVYARRSGSFIPSLTYDRSSGTVGLGFDIEGITY